MVASHLVLAAVRRQASALSLFNPLWAVHRRIHCGRQIHVEQYCAACTCCPAIKSSAISPSRILVSTAIKTTTTGVAIWLRVATDGISAGDHCHSGASTLCVSFGMDAQKALAAVFVVDDGDLSSLSSDASSDDEGLSLSNNNSDGDCDVVSELTGQ